MDMATQGSGRLTIRLQHFLVLSWNLLRQFRTTGILLAILALVFGLALWLPQQSNPQIPASIWVKSLPAWLQPRGEELFALGFAHIFRSIWFWLPVALLTLHSLVALADTLPPAWRRFREAPADPEWQHPLARRAEYSTRLPAAPDEFLEQLKKSLSEGGFTIDPAVEEGQRLVSARRQAWSWLSLPMFYGSLCLLCLGFLISRYTLEIEWLTLLPFETKNSRLFDSAFQLNGFDTTSGTGLVLPEAGAETAGQALSWRLYWPALVEGAFVLPITAEPVLTVEAQDENGAALTLFSPQPEDVSPATKLNLALRAPQAPLYFVIPSASLAFQITPVAAPEGVAYNLQVVNSSASASPENRLIKAGETFQVDNLSISLSLNHALQVVAWRDWGWPLYLVSLLGLIGAPLLLRLYPPWQAWLIPDIKGRGGQIYGVAEKLGATKEIIPFLEQLLTRNNPALETPPEEEVAGIDQIIRQA
jgi:hypothetical protein